LSTQCRQERFYGPVKKKKIGTPPDRGGIAKNLYTEQETLTLSCRMTWAWSERIYFYSQQIMILLKNTKTQATYLTPFLDRWVPVICTGFPSPLLSALVPFFQTSSLTIWERLP